MLIGQCILLAGGMQGAVGGGMSRKASRRRRRKANRNVPVPWGYVSESVHVVRLSL